MGCPVVYGASGFSMSLEEPPSEVSSYLEPPSRLSVSLSEPLYPNLSRYLNRNPKVVASSYEKKTLRFNTTIYKHGRDSLTLVPVATDAERYMAKRLVQKLDQNFYKALTQSLKNPDARKKRQGLGLSLQLPTRLQRVFGEGGAGLRVNGFRKITFAGRSQWTEASNSPVYSQSKFPSLHMEQFYRFDITGNIGSKITVKVSQDSQTDIPLTNTLQIRYKGDEDDILKSIEAGNTNLKLPNTQFVGYSSRIQGLFGVKAEAQVGNLRIVGIASQEKGSSERTRVTPSGEESAKIIRDNEYVERRIFDLGRPGDFQPGDDIISLFVYEELVQTQDIRPGDALYARMYVNPAYPDSFSSESVILTDAQAGVIQVQPDQYEYYSLPDSNKYYIIFKSPRRNRALGVQMQIKRGTDTIFVGSISDTASLKLLYSPDMTPDYQVWNLMWRNCYAIPKGVTIDDFDLKVYKGLKNSENSSTSLDYQQTDLGTETYLEILGLDQYDATGKKVPDGKLDDRFEIFRPDLGLLIFPHRRPFANDTTFVSETGKETQPLQDTVHNIYFYLPRGTEKTDASRYFLKLFTKSRSTIIRLGKPNIIEGSESITLNGRQLQKGKDYTIDYSFGQVTLLTDEAGDPNADINIDFSYAPFFAVQKKTLLGLRAEYEWNKDFKIGSTVLFKSDKAQDRKPRVGMETAKATVFDVDASLSLRPNFLTKLANALPFYSTETPSNLKLSGEIAQSHPNPNVEGKAYIDDFEASSEHLTLGTNRTLWRKSSRPLQVELDRERAKLLWHNPRDPLNIEDVYDRDPRQGSGTLRSLRMVFRPNYLDTIWDTTVVGEDTTYSIVSIEEPAIPRKSWAGITRFFGGRIDSKRIQLFEFRARASKGAVLHFDFGKVSEDINGDGNAFNEDQTNTGNFLPSEDVGLDGLPDSLEPRYDPITNPDPNGDDWFFLGDGKCPLSPDECATLQDPNAWNDSLYYEWLNGTEGNKTDFEFLEIPDKEAFENGMRTENGYFSYTVVFDPDHPSPFRVDESKFEGTRGDEPWYTYRIPIRDPELLDGIFTDNPEDPAIQPDWDASRIRHVRVWFESRDGQTTPDTVEIADWYFVQSNWRDTLITPDSMTTTTQFVVASISEEDSTFIAPPGVEAYVDPTTDVTESQKGLLLKYENLDYHDTCLAVKHLLSVDRYSGYRKLEMYVHGKHGSPIDEGKVLFFFRLGTDSVNFYEQRRFIRDGWNESNYISMDFNQITALKDAFQRTHPRTEWRNADTLAGDLRVKGNPNLNEIKYFAAGVINLDTLNNHKVSGEIWLDELRVTEVRRDVGTAGRLSINGTVADLGSYSFSFQSRDPYFRGLSSSTRGGSSENLGSGQTQTSLAYSVQLNLDKFLPKSWGARIPINYNFNKSTSTPLLRNGSDIILPEEIRRSEQSTSRSLSFTASESFNRKGRNPLFNLLLNRLKTSFSYRRNTRTSVNVPYSLGENYNIRQSFDMSVKKPPSLPIFFWTKWIPIFNRLSESRLGLYPSVWRMSGGYDRNLQISDDIDGNRRSSLKRNLDAKMDITYPVFQNLSVTLHYDTRRDLSNPDDLRLKLRDPKIGIELNFNQSATVNYKPKLIWFATTDLSYQATYSDSWERSSESRRSNMSRSWGIKGTFDHMKLFGGKGSGRSGYQRGRRGRGGYRAGSEKNNDKNKTKGSGKPFYDPPLAVFRFLTSWIQPVKYNYSENFNMSLPGMRERPSLKYRLGLTREANVLTIAQGLNPNSGEGQKYEFSSGFKFLGGISTDVRFKRSIAKDLIKQGKRYKKVSTNWPDLIIKIQRFKYFPLLKGPLNKFIDVFTPRTGYTRTLSENYDIDGGFIISRSTTISQNPLLGVNFKLFRTLSLSGSYNLTRDIKDEFNPNTGEFRSQGKTTRKSIGLSTKYSFSSPSGINLPLFGRIKFRSTVSITIDVKKNQSITENYDSKGNITSSSEKSDFTVSPDIAYTFSKQIRGGLRMRWSDSNTNNRKSHLREVQLWVEIRF